MASVGQGEAQAPQPVHRSVSITGLGAWPMADLKLMARSSQASLQLWHHTPLYARQVSCTTAFNSQGACAVSRNKGSGQTSTHFLQKVHSSSAKLISGKPPSPRKIICVSQALIHLSQRVQISVNSISVLLHGGRMALDFFRLKRRRRL